MDIVSHQYRNYRSNLISKPELRELHLLRPWNVIRDTFLHWGIILASWAVIIIHLSWWTVAISVVLTATQLYALKIIGHDGFHRRLFNLKRTNDIWADIFINAPIGAINRLNRNNHMLHHSNLSLASDPDRRKYDQTGKETRCRYALFLTGLPNFLPAARNVYSKKASAEKSSKDQSYQLHDILLIGAWQLALFSGLTYFIGWWAYIVLWIIPVYLGPYMFNMMRSFAEHSIPGDNDDTGSSSRLITYQSNWLERQFLSPHNMNLHIEHHLWPGIPYYNLPKANALIKQSESLDENLVWRTSYFRYLVDYWNYLSPCSNTP